MAASGSAGPSQAGSMSAPQWRQFTFFDLDEVKDSEDLAQSPRALRDLRPPIVLTPTSPTSPLSPSLILSSNQTISLLSRQFVVEKAWRAWENNGRATALLEAGGLLVGIGEEEGSRYPVLKVWDLTREERRGKGGGPVMLRNVKIQHGQRPHPVSAIALTSNLSHLAIGLGDGTVLLYRHLLQSLTTSPTALTSLPKARVIHESPEPITGLGFREPPTPTSSASSAKAPESDRQASLFIVTTNRVLCAPVSGKGGETRTVDELGCGLGCAAMDWERREMVVARDEAIYLYGPEGRGACYAYEGPKSSISIYKHNLLITSPPFFPTAGSASATVRNYVSKTSSAGDGAGPSDIAKVTVFDLQNKIVSYSGTFRDGVREVFSQWGSVFVLGGSGKLSRLDEHSTSTKLEVLYRRNLYTLAVSLARSQGLGDAGVADIHRRYGDYLYGKGDFDGAMGQFVRTLGFLQPSYVIRKFLDAQRIHNLTTYLQELHSRNLANPDHTTLLLNCYTKTGDKARLDSFVKTASSTSSDELPFDLDTAIRVCRQAGFYEHATYLAQKYGRHEEYLRIQIEDAEQYAEAIEYLRSLGPEACQENLVMYGKTLLQRVPEATTELLIDLCAGDLGKSKPAHVNVATDASRVSNGTGGPNALAYLRLNRVTELFGGDAPSSPAPASTEDKSVNGDSRPLRAATVDTDVSEKVADAVAETPAYDPPSPRRFFSHFVDQSSLFIHFLEAISQALYRRAIPSAPPSRDTPIAPRSTDMTAVDADQQAVYNTLLELYLSGATSSDSTEQKTARDKALGLLASDAPYDSMHALMLCSTASFVEGMVGIWESLGMYDDVLRYYMEQPSPPASSSDEEDPSDRALEYLDLYGPTQVHLYPLTLRYLTSTPYLLSRHAARIPPLLSTISDQRLLPPLSLINLLSRNSNTSIGTIKPWLISKIAELRQDVESDKSLVESYRKETEGKEKEMKALADPRRAEVFQATRCAGCGGALDLPSTHFMCGHSYHQRCLSDSEPECTLCARQHSIIREVRRNQTRLADRHDLFLGEVKEADDGFAVLAGAFGRGIMDKPVKE